MKKYIYLAVILTLIFSSCSTEEPIPTYTLAVSVSPAEAGKITVSPQSPNYPEGSQVTLTPEPNEYWVFKQWDGDVTGNTNPLQVTMTANTSITAVFVKRDYPLNLKIEGEGTVDEKIVSNLGGREYPHGTIVELTPKPKEGWVFESWSGDLTGTESPKTIKVDKERNVTVKFVRKQPIFLLYKESYLNQRSGVAFWWYDSNGFKTNVNESNGYFSGGQAYHDVNNDGFMDILVTHHTNENTSNVVWYINDGTNEMFNKSTTFINGNTNGLNSHKILKTDVNNDGLADFILLGVDESQPGNFGGNFTVLLQLTNKTFNLIRIDEGKGLWYHNGAAGDLNKDGNVDVVAAEYIWWGDGKGNFTNSNINIGQYANDVLAYEIIDIDKDGFNDLILGTAGIRSPTTIVLNNSGKFDTTNKKVLLPLDTNSGIHDIEIYDIDSDGDLDIIELRVDANSTRTKIYSYINTNLNFQLMPNYIQNSEDGNYLNGNFDKNGWTTFKFDDMDNDGIDDIRAENFQDGNYNGLKKINGVWSKYLFKF